jgi:hypothetical protein
VLGASLAGMTGLGALAGCSGTSPAPEASGSAQARPTSVTPDVQTATVALAAVRAAHQAVTATAQRFPAVRPALSALAATHAAHERSLVNAVPARERGTSTPAPYVVPARRDVALQRVRAEEDKVHGSLQALALKAQSGEFARLLAGMAAAVTVHRQALEAAG